MSKVTVYTTRYCPHCARAKNLLKRKGITYEEIDITEDARKRQELEERYGWMTVPVVIINDQFIGGANELRELEQSGKLDQFV